MPMRSYVAYHNTDKMGYRFEEALEQFSFLTKKPVAHLSGARVWSISGDEQPRKYLLHDWFWAEKVERSTQEPFTYCLKGTKGFTFKKPIHLNELPWFSRFLRSQGNFSLGIQPINEEFVLQFEALADGTTP